MQRITVMFTSVTLFLIFYAIQAVPVNTKIKKDKEVQKAKENQIEGDPKRDKVNQDNVKDMILNLEKEKSNLFQQINEAIDDSVKALQTVNDTFSEDGISYVQELKNQISELNFADDIDDVNYNLSNIQFFRRSFHNKSSKGLDKITVDNNSSKGLDETMLQNNSSKGTKDERRQLEMRPLPAEFNMKNVFGNPEDAKYMNRYQNRIVIQQLLNDWLKEREKEQEKLDQAKALLARLPPPEKCPREGVAKPKKKETRRKAKRSYKGVYPCCRKCCKRSYMGCL